MDSVKTKFEGSHWSGGSNNLTLELNVASPHTVIRGNITSGDVLDFKLLTQDVTEDSWTRSFRHLGFRQQETKSPTLWRELVYDLSAST